MSAYLGKQSLKLFIGKALEARPQFTFGMEGESQDSLAIILVDGFHNKGLGFPVPQNTPSFSHGIS
jgi:hypothetical protein